MLFENMMGSAVTGRVRRCGFETAVIMAFERESTLTPFGKEVSIKVQRDGCWSGSGSGPRPRPARVSSRCSYSVVSYRLEQVSLRLACLCCLGAQCKDVLSMASASAVLLHMTVTVGDSGACSANTVLHTSTKQGGARDENKKPVHICHEHGPNCSPRSTQGPLLLPPPPQLPVHQAPQTSIVVHQGHSQAHQHQRQKRRQQVQPHQHLFLPLNLLPPTARSDPHRRALEKKLRGD